MLQESRSRLAITAAIGVVAIAAALFAVGRESNPPPITRTPVPAVSAPPASNTGPHVSGISGALGAGAKVSSPFSMDGFSLPVLPQDAGRKQSEESIGKLRGALQRNPSDLKTRIQLAVALDSAGDASTAEDVLRAALQRGQKKAEVFHAMGMLYLRNQIFTGAADAFLIETRLKPKDFHARFNLGASYAYLAMNVEARKQFEIAQKLDPTVPEVYMGLAFLNNGSDRYPYAVKYLQEYIKRAPNPGNGYALLSRVYLNMRQFDRAIESGTKAVKSMPDNPYVWYNLGQAYLYKPDHENVKEAAEAFTKAVGFSPTWAGAHFELGRALVRLNRNPEAATSYRDAVKYDPSNGRYRYQLGQLLTQMGQAEEGKKVLASANKLIKLNQDENRLLNQLTSNPRNVRRLVELARVYKELGDLPRAASVLQSALSVNPKDTEARAEQARLQASMPRS